MERNYAGSVSLSVKLHAELDRPINGYLRRAELSRERMSKLRARQVVRTTSLVPFGRPVYVN